MEEVEGKLYKKSDGTLIFKPTEKGCGCGCTSGFALLIFIMIVGFFTGDSDAMNLTKNVFGGIWAVISFIIYLIFYPVLFIIAIFIIKSIIVSHLSFIGKILSIIATIIGAFFVMYLFQLIF